MPEARRGRPQPPPRKKRPAAAKPAAAPVKPPLRAVKGAKPREPKAADPTRRRAVVWGALLSVVFVGVLFVFVYPTQTFLDQRDATNKAREQLRVLHAESTKLADAAKRLERDDEIARLAREKYGLVKPGEQPFVILPAPSTTAPAPTPSETATLKP